ncbi:DUF1697 domain-containing protein [Rhodobacter sp. Har01]|uniref:DUF1697 domain-containing protein n=1 Tax=Rhodobacter sp. Har01 TaxID=2883999 RepID=UPI001D08131F|nr:DUF1697 domain-containing protein [Rhodobacter sp. Har01]MCB6178786.1 DUF1697 domain-containing protein [Rhodobacter sp. Har01]
MTGAPRAVLLRGVNVSGRNRLPMAPFRALLEGLGLRRVETFIQSGNAVFEGGPQDSALGPAIRGAIEAGFGFAPEVFLRRLPDLEAALDHPFGPAADPARIHAVFLAETAPAFDEARLQAVRKDEAWVLRPRLLLLHTPGGMGTSKVAEALPRALKGPQTARNLKTVAALALLLRSRRREGTGG